MLGTDRLRTGRSQSCCSLIRHLVVRFTWLKPPITHGSESTVAAAETSTRLTSIQTTDFQPDVYSRHTMFQESWMQT